MVAAPVHVMALLRPSLASTVCEVADRYVQDEDGGATSKLEVGTAKCQDVGLVLNNFLVGGLDHFLFSIIYGMSSFPLTNSYFSEG